MSQGECDQHILAGGGGGRCSCVCTARLAVLPASALWKYKVVVVVVVAQGSCVFVLLGYDGAFLNCCLAVDVCEVLGGVQYGVRAVR